MSGAFDPAGLLASFNSAAPALTLLRVAPGIAMTGPPVDGVTALLVLSGTLYLAVDGEEPQCIKPGRLALIPAGLTAQLAATRDTHRVVEGRQCLTRRDGWLTADAAPGQDAALIVGAARIAGSGPEALPATLTSAVTKCAIGKPLFALLRAECARGAAGQPALANALMSACVVQGLRRAIDRAPISAPSPIQRGLIGSAIAAVRTQPAQRHTIDTLATTAGMSRSSFLRHFKRLMQVGPNDYIKQVRLDEARAMLETSDLSVQTIAERSGFASRSHFSRAFRAAFGRDPTSYRDLAGDVVHVDEINGAPAGQ